MKTEQKKRLVFSIISGISILLFILLFMMFRQGNNEKENEIPQIYESGIYMRDIVVGDAIVGIMICLDEQNIKSVELINMDEDISAMYPLLEPSVENISEQLSAGKSIDEVILSDEGQYTEKMILNEILEVLLEHRIKSETTTNNNDTTDNNNDTKNTVSGENSIVESDYFASAKRTREETRAKNKETLMNIVNSKSVASADKQSAIKQIANITKNSEKENAAELVLQAKGFENAIVSINDGNADVVVDANGLTEEQIAQIKDMVSKKTGIEADKIVITPVKVIDGNE